MQIKASNNNMKIKELQKHFIGRGEVKGFVFTQLLKTDHAYLYQVECDFSSEGYDRVGVHYEVFERRVNTRYGTVSYPKSTAFGIWAFTRKDFNVAVAKLSELDERVRERIARRERGEVIEEDNELMEEEEEYADA